MHLKIIESREQAIDMFAHETDPAPVGSLTAPVLYRLAELSSVLADSDMVTLVRDWEGCLVGLVDDKSRVFSGETLAFTESGTVGFGGVNHPKYRDSIAALLLDA